MTVRKKILWADDEIEYLRSHIMFLETRGYSVVPVFCGDDAIALVNDQPDSFDIVLLDEQMPGKSGITTLEKIKEINPDLPVVMVTKSEEEQLMEDALGKKINGYLTKPVNPSQILLVCKNILDSKRILSDTISQRYIRNYSENRSLLSGHLTNQQWIKLYEDLTNWGIALETAENEGLRQTHSGQKSDSNAKFSSAYIQNYSHWIKDPETAPLLSTNVFEKYLFPLLNDNKKTFLIVLSGMRLDQYIGIENILKPLFKIDRNYFYSVLPTDNLFSRTALFSSMLPSELVLSESPHWSITIDKNDEIHITSSEEQLLFDNLLRNGFSVYNDEPWYTRITEQFEQEELSSRVKSCQKSQMITLVVDFFDQLLQAGNSSGILHELTHDESGLRALTKSWFERSSLFHLLQEIITEECRVVILSDHGSILCSRGTELYCVKSFEQNLRYKFGNDISCDERTVVYLSDPVHYGLPSLSDNIRCIIAKENYYFTQPDKFEHYNRHYKNTFQQGGVSMEEIIVPISICTPKII